MLDLVITCITANPFELYAKSIGKNDKNESTYNLTSHLRLNLHKTLNLLSSVYVAFHVDFIKPANKLKSK